MNKFDELDAIHNRLEKLYEDMAAGRPLERSEELNRLAQRVVDRMAEDKRRYEAASPAERARIDEERIRAGVAFIMDERMGGP